MSIQTPRRPERSRVGLLVALVLLVSAAGAVTVAALAVAEATGLGIWVPVGLLVVLASLLVVFD